jgi:hypothetical protein
VWRLAPSAPAGSAASAKSAAAPATSERKHGPLRPRQAIAAGAY